VTFIVIPPENRPAVARIFVAKQGSADAACPKASKEVLTQGCGKKTDATGRFSGGMTITAQPGALQKLAAALSNLLFFRPKTYSAS